MEWLCLVSCFNVMSRGLPCSCASPVCHWKDSRLPCWLVAAFLGLVVLLALLRADPGTQGHFPSGRAVCRLAENPENTQVLFVSGLVTFSLETLTPQCMPNSPNMWSMSLVLVYFLGILNKSTKTWTMELKLTISASPDKEHTCMHLRLLIKSHRSNGVGCQIYSGSMFQNILGSLNAKDLFKLLH